MLKLQLILLLSKKKTYFHLTSGFNPLKGITLRSLKTYAMKLNKLAGYNIKRLREEKHIKQEVLARELNISVQTLSAIENGKRDIKLSQIENCADILRTLPTNFLLSTEQQLSPAEKLNFADAVLKVIDINAAANIQSMDIFQLQQQYEDMLQKINDIKHKLEEIFGK